MSPVLRIRSQWASAVLLAVSLAGCSKSSTKPSTPAPPATRQVVVIVADTTGARVPDAIVGAFGIDDASGGQQVDPVLADAAGTTTFNLVDGRWCISGSNGSFSSPVLVAGSTGTVAARPAGAPDTILFRLVLRPQSIARGKITLTGQSAFGGTLVGVLGISAFASTEADGSYELDGLPPGSWTTLVAHVGFQPAQFTLVVAAPADTVTPAPIALMPAPTPLARR